jgi:hypothetical protein
MQICDTYSRTMQAEDKAVGGGWNRASQSKRGLRVDCDNIMMNEITVKGKLVDAKQLLDALFDKDARPSIRWLRQQTKAKAIPFFRIGHLVFFDVDMVRAALAGKNLVGGRHLNAS